MTCVIIIYLPFIFGAFIRRPYERIKTMNRKISGSICTMLCIVMLLGAIQAVTLGVSAAEGLAAEEPVGYYGREAISKLPNSDALLFAYDTLVEGIENSKETISIKDSSKKITTSELSVVMDAYRRDHVEHFWYGTSYSYSYNPETSVVVSISPTYTMSGAALTEAKRDFELNTAILLEGIDASMSEYEREKLIHDRLAARVRYDASAGHAHDPYGAIVEGLAVCEGYAEALQHLLMKAGIQSFIVTGSSINPSTGSPEGHAWNLVRIDGRYYHVDLTWDDQESYTFYAYFNKTTAEIKEDHAIDPTVYALPECTDKAADYFTVNGGIMDAYNSDAVAERLKQGYGMARVYVTGKKDDFLNAFQADISNLMVKLGLTSGCRYGYSGVGRELILSVYSTNHTHVWDEKFATSETHHWHECLAAGCELTSDEGKGDYATHTPGEWIIDEAASFGKTGKRHRECSVCRKVTESEIIAAKDFSNITLKHNCSFGNDLSMLYAILKSDLDGCENIRLIVEKEIFSGNTPAGKASKTLYPEDFLIDGEEYYRFDYRQVRAKELGDTLTATLVFTKNGIEYSGVVDVYSLKQYAEERLEASENDSFKALLVDLLNYGSAAQVYFAYRTDSLANKDLTEAQKALSRGHYDALTEITASSAPSSYTAAVTKKNILFDNRIQLVIATNLAKDSDLTGISLRVRYTDSDGQKVDTLIDGSEFVYRNDVKGQTAYFDALKASELRKELELTLVKDGVEISETVKYSFETYVKKKLQSSADENFKALLEKTMIYSDSAKDYFANNSK